MLIKLCFSFIASSATAVLYNIERRLIIYCGISGMFTWFMYSLFSTLGLSEALASLLALLCLTFLSRLFNKITSIPNMIFNISGIMPIVPGGLLFKTFNNLADKHYEIALTDGFQAVLVAGAIAVGFIVNEVMTKYLYLIKKRIKSD